jgi:predicted nucleotidyltransferase
LTVERLAGRSHAQVREVLRRLSGEGLVDATRAGNAVQYLLNREHVLADAVVSAAFAASIVEERLSTFLKTCQPAPVSVVVFGSFARRDGASESDVDVLVIRSDALDPDDASWGEVRTDIARKLERWTGNPCQVIELSVSEIQDADAKDETLMSALRAEGRGVFGLALPELLDDPVSLRSNSRGPVSS